MTVDDDVVVATIDPAMVTRMIHPAIRKIYINRKLEKSTMRRIFQKHFDFFSHLIRPLFFKVYTI